MLNEGPTDYPRSILEKDVHQSNDYLPQHKSCSDRLIQKFTGMVDRCLDQQWKDSQQLLGCAQALKESGAALNSGGIIKELSDLGLGMMQKSIDMRQELVDNTYTIDLGRQPIKDSSRCTSKSYSDQYEDSLHEFVNSDIGGGVETFSTKMGDPSCYSFLPSSPESDIYEPLLTKIRKRLPHSTDDDDEKRLSVSSDTGSCYSPFTLHSKLWQHHLQQKCSDSLSSSSSSSSIGSTDLVSASTSTLYTLNSSKHNNGKANLQSLLATSPAAASTQQQRQSIDGKSTTNNRNSTQCLHASTYNDCCHSPSLLSSAQVTTSELDIQCQQCSFWPRQRSLSLDELAPSLCNEDAAEASAIDQDSNCNKWETHSYDDQVKGNDKNDNGSVDRIGASRSTTGTTGPSIHIPIRTSSSLDTATATPFMITVPKATMSTPLLGTTAAPHSTSCKPPSSMVNAMSAKFHFKRNTASTPKKKSLIPVPSSSACQHPFSHHRTASAIDDNNISFSDSGKSSKFVRSLITRKVSFPAIFSSKKIHPAASVSSTERPDGLFI